MRDAPPWLEDAAMWWVAMLPMLLIEEALSHYLHRRRMREEREWAEAQAGKERSEDRAARSAEALEERIQALEALFEPVEEEED